MTSLWKAAALLAALLVPAAAEAAELRIVPADAIFLNPTNTGRGYSDLLVHAVVVAAGPHENATLTALRIEILSKGRAALTREVAPEEMAGTAQGMAGAPFPEFVEGQLLDPKGLAGLFGRPVTFATSPAMTPATALIAARLHFSVGFVPDMVRATATLSGTSGDTTVSASVPVRTYASPISYRAPLAGEWMMQAVPGVQSHHRFNPTTEFAVDFFKLGPDGHVAHGDSLDAHNYYGFGAPVMAAADGTVVAAISDQVQDRAALLRKPGEANESFYKRVNQFHMTGMAKNFRAANAGNLITIRHEKNGVIEYSSYGHLQSGSIQVKPGDHVVQGQVIAKVGDTGDSAAVHLHFQINAGPDPFTSKSLPVAFSDLGSVDGDDELGRLVNLGAGKDTNY